MPDISIQANATCDTGGGVISGDWGAINVQNASVSIYGLSTNTSESLPFASSSGDTFEFTGLPDDTYEVSVFGDADGGGNILFRTVACASSGGGGCEIIITGVSINYGTPEAMGIFATVNASGSGALEYSLDGGAYQSGNTFEVNPGTHTATARVITDTGCVATTTFLVAEPGALAVVSVTPTRDWLPAGQDIIYTFESPNATPQPLAIRIEVSSNGINFSSPITAGVLVLSPDSNKRYTANVAPYLEAMFTPGNPILSGQDFNLFKRYRILAGELPGFNGYTGTPELTTQDAFCLFATELTPITTGFITLTKAPITINNAAFSGIETAVNLGTNELRTLGITYDTENPNPQTCFKYPIQLYWLNRAGGWQTWVFDGKHEYEEEAGEGVYWKDANDATHLASIPGITEKVQVFSGFIPLSVYDTIFGLLSSIRVYHRDNNVWREVNVEKGSFPKHKEGLRRKELNFSFTYAQTLTVQNA